MGHCPMRGRPDVQRNPDDVPFRWHTHDACLCLDLHEWPSNVYAPMMKQTCPACGADRCSAHQGASRCTRATGHGRRHLFK